MQLKPIRPVHSAPTLTIGTDVDGDVAIYAVLPNGNSIKLAYIGSRDGTLYTTALDDGERAALSDFICFNNSNEWKVL